MYIGEWGERLAAGYAFPYYGWHAAFLSEEVNDWYVGGLDDMAVNTVWKWHDVIHYLETGTELPGVHLLHNNEEETGEHERLVHHQNHLHKQKHKSKATERHEQMVSSTHQASFFYA